MNIRKTNLSDSHTDGFMRFEEWEHTYQKEQQKTNIVIDMIVFIFGFFFIGIVIPVFPAMVIEAFFPEFPSFIVCFLLGLSFFGWLHLSDMMSERRKNEIMSLVVASL